MFHDRRSELVREDYGAKELTGLDILESLIKSVIKNGKSPEYNEIYAKLFKLIDVKIITELFNKVYKSGQIPKDWPKSMFIVLPKKNHTKSCGDID